MNFFSPLSTHSSPSSTAVVRMAAGSLPAPASVRPKQPSTWPLATGVRKAFFCSSVPKAFTGKQYSELFTLMITPTLASPRLISLKAST